MTVAPIPARYDALCLILRHFSGVPRLPAANDNPATSW